MTDLTRKHCEKLKDWGMDQELKKGDWYWYFREGNQSWEVCLAKYGVGTFVKYFKIHTLDELMEFAKTLDANFNISPCPVGWEMVRTSDSGLFIERICNKSPKLAVYKLISKLKEVECGD